MRIQLGYPEIEAKKKYVENSTGQYSTRIRNGNGYFRIY
jgi:hypothetical protein